jgi:transposase
MPGTGVESHFVDISSIAAWRRKRRVKTDRIDREMVLRP